MKKSPTFAGLLEIRFDIGCRLPHYCFSHETETSIPNSYRIAKHGKCCGSTLVWLSPMHCKFLALFVADHQKSEYCLQVFECAPDKRLGLLYGEIVTGDWSTIRIADICKQVQASKRSAGYTITGNYPHSSGSYDFKNETGEKG